MSLDDADRLALSLNSEEDDWFYEVLPYERYEPQTIPGQSQEVYGDGDYIVVVYDEFGGLIGAL